MDSWFGNTRQVSVAVPVVASAAYASGDALGSAAIRVPSAAAADGRLSVLRTLVLTDLAKQNAAINLLVFERNPTGTTLTDNAAVDVADADIAKLIGFLKILSTDYVSLNDNSLAVTKPDLAFRTSANGSIWLIAMSAGTPTYASTADLYLKLTFDQA